jgi:hypothetical protein
MKNLSRSVLAAAAKLEGMLTIADMGLSAGVTGVKK